MCDGSYVSLLCGGSSSATTSDAKELYLIKTCKNGKPRFDFLLLQQPDETSVSGLHLRVIDSVRSTNFSFERKERMVSLGSDGTIGNKRLHELEKEEIGDDLIFTWCLSHELELDLQKVASTGK